MSVYKKIVQFGVIFQISLHLVILYRLICVYSLYTIDVNTFFSSTFLLCAMCLFKSVCVPVCVLLERNDVAMVRCSNPECQNGSWFHYDCVGITSAPDDFDWWCSDDCRSTGSSAVCRCNQVRTGSPLVICANANCNKGATFHMSCVGLKELPGHNFFLCCDRFHFYYTPYTRPILLRPREVCAVLF